MDTGEKFIVLYTSNEGYLRRAEGPYPESEAFARRNWLFDVFGAKSVELVKFEVAEGSTRHGAEDRDHCL